MHVLALICRVLSVSLLLLVASRATSGETLPANQSTVTTPVKLGYQLLQTKSHNEDWFTQGLILDGDTFVESAGRYRVSEVIRYNADDNSVIQRYKLAARQFAEGLTRLHDTLYLLTWQNEQLLTFDPTLQLQQTITYTGQGWGLTHNGHQLIMSDGSANLYFRNAESFAIERTITAHSWQIHKQTLQQKTWDNLNELEYVDGIIWANQWQTDRILAIDAQTGQVLATLPLTPLVLEQQQRGSSSNSVLNGIAYVPEEQAFWVTGKLWNKRYLIRPSTWPTTSPAKLIGTEEATQ